MKIIFEFEKKESNVISPKKLILSTEKPFFSFKKEVVAFEVHFAWFIVQNYFFHNESKIISDIEAIKSFAKCKYYINNVRINSPFRKILISPNTSFRYES